MTNWYYVQGTERMGPIEEKELHSIFLQGTIQADSYVWTKGYANWERLQSVLELSYFFKENEEELNHQEVDSPEVQFYFDWKKLRVTEEMFYIETGKDRAQTDEILGPYSLQELQAAFLQKRISEQTYIYTPGMLYWERVGAIPTLQTLWKLEGHVGSSLEMKSPGLVVFDRQPVPVVSVIKRVYDDKMTILTNVQFTVGDELVVTLYKREELMAKNIKITILATNTRNQFIIGDFSELDPAEKKLIYECVE